MKEFYSPQLAGGGSLAKAAPMMANPDYWAQEKLDGCRYILHYGLDGEVKVYSRRTSDDKRSANYGKPVLKTDRVPHLVEEVKRLFKPGLVLDGEIITVDPEVPTDGRSAAVTSIIGSSPDEAVRKQAKYPLEFAAFDLLAYKGTDITGLLLTQRFALLQDILPRETEAHDYLWHLGFKAGSQVEKEAFLGEIWERGGEGIILKDCHSEYREGSRNKVWTKVKEHLTFDCIITGFEEAKELSEKVDGTISQTKYKGQVGKITFGQYNSQGQLIEIGKASGFTDAIRRDMTDHPERWIGRVIVVDAHQQLPSGKLRHPRTKAIIRTDKDPKDCVILGDLGG